MNMSDIVKATELKLTIDQNNPFQMPLRQIMQIWVTPCLNMPEARQDDRVQVCL